MTRHKNGQNKHICNHLSALGIYFKILDDKFVVSQVIDGLAVSF